jgi:hypothetical protein
VHPSSWRGRRSGAASDGRRDAGALAVAAGEKAAKGLTWSEPLVYGPHARGREESSTPGLTVLSPSMDKVQKSLCSSVKYGLRARGRELTSYDIITRGVVWPTRTRERGSVPKLDRSRKPTCGREAILASTNSVEAKENKELRAAFNAIGGVWPRVRAGGGIELIDSLTEKSYSPRARGRVFCRPSNSTNGTYGPRARGRVGRYPITRSSGMALKRMAHARWIEGCRLRRYP